MRLAPVRGLAGGAGHGRGAASAIATALLTYAAPMYAALATGTIVAPAVAVHAPAAPAVAATPATLASPVATAIAAPLLTWQRQGHPRSQHRLCRAQLRRMQRMPPAPLEPSHDLCGASGMRNRSSACYRLAPMYAELSKTSMPPGQSGPFAITITSRFCGACNRSHSSTGLQLAQGRTKCRFYVASVDDAWAR